MVFKTFQHKWLWHYLENLENLLGRSIKVSYRGDFQYWRERLFSTVFIPMIIGGFFVCVPGVILAVKLQKWGVVTIDILMYSIALSIVVFRKIPFIIRACIGVMIFYLLGLFLLVINGPIGAGYIWLFSFPILTGAFLGTSAGLIALSINISTVAVIAILLYLKYLSWDSLPLYTFAEWIVTSINLIFLNVIVTISFTSLFQGLRRTLEKEQAVSAQLNQEHRRVLKTVKQLNMEMHERKKAEDEKLKLERQLQQAQKMESIGTLAGGIAHDFNNILYPIIGFTELTITEMPKDSLAYKNLNEVHIAAKRAKNLVQQILRFSRMDAPGFKPVKIQEIIQESLGLLRASIPSSIDIHQDIDKDCGPIMADPTQIHQIIVNLCTNAYQAMEDTYGRLDICLKTYDVLPKNKPTEVKLTSAQYAVVSIKDTGPGMTQDVIERIFDPYFTTKEMGKGTGLGLSVVHGIVKSHGGEIQVDSAPGKGTTFYVYLPIIEEGVEIEELETSDIVVSGTESILVVDDEEPILIMIKQMLERLGYVVETRSSSLEALSLFRFKPERFDLIITDMTMPGMNGLELTQRLKEIKREIPVILCTGFSEKITDQTVKTYGIDGFVLKPIVKDQLATLIRDILDRHIIEVPEVKKKALG